MVIKTATKEGFTTMRKNKTHLPITQRNMVVINTVNMAEGTDLASMDTVNMVEVTVYNTAHSAENTKDMVMEKAKSTMMDKNRIHKPLQGGNKKHLMLI